MKTYRDLWPQLVSWDNLVLAYHKCRRRKRNRPDAARFDFAWESHLLELQRELTAGRYAPGPYHHFYIFDPKKRKISAAPFRDRIVHHAIVNVLEPLYERQFIFDSYACRRGKGTHRALDRAQLFLRRHPWYLKTDVVKFFPSVDHEVLLQVLSRRLADSRVMDLIRTVIATGAGVLDTEAEFVHFPGDDLLSVCRPRGLPIGNLTSQFFANVLLNEVDHFIKDRLRIPGYVRYCDDLVLFANDKQRLRTMREELEQEMTRLRLRLHADKTQLRPGVCGLKFLGFVLHRHGRRLQQGALRRMSRRIRLWRWLRRSGKLSVEQIAPSVQAWRAHGSHANTRAIQRVLLSRLRRR